jgi:GTP-binding protein HflX
VVAVLVDRAGKVREVMVGDAERVYLPDIGRQRAGASRFRGIRLLRTNLHDEPRAVALTRDDVTDMSQLQLDAVVSVGVGPGGYPGQTAWAHLVPPNPDRVVHEELRAPNPSELEAEVDFDRFIAELESEFQRKSTQTYATDGTPAMLAYVATPGGRSEAVELEEMRELCRTAGVEVVDEVVQRRTTLHPKYAIGRGKLEDLTQQALQRDVDLLIFGQDLSPGQMRAITGETSLKVIDRTQLILDIFAQHAKSADGKLQVELAQLRYNLPRLSDRHTGMSRLMGGIGGRGPGETKLEINRRRARDRIRSLEGQIEKLSKQRALRRKRRVSSGDPIVSVVGYTNAGKSTLLNQLTNASVLSEDKLFATLRPTSRKLGLDARRSLVLTDTVGFIHDLPPDLVAAFKATLEELEESDVLLHLVDVSEEQAGERIAAVDRILAELGLGEKRTLVVFNKIDRVTERETMSMKLRYGAMGVSALDPTTLKPLVERLERMVFDGA